MGELRLMKKKTDLTRIIIYVILIGGVIVAIPVAILFMCLQKYYVEGVTGGAVKG